LPQIGPLEILVIFIVALVVFGPSKLPQIGRQVGRGFREFRKFQAGLRDDIEGAFHEDDNEPDDDVDDTPKQLEAGKPEHAQPEIGKPETAKPETAKPETAKPETAKPETGKSSEPPSADTSS
jgi:TatA/E family protein of Tat protein translocase